MDLLSTIRKSGSRGGVNFSWDEVANSSHRENYLGHSLKAPVGRWAKGRDLNWYAKADAAPADAGSAAETDDERQARERREELRKIKEAEEDAIARALGLPVKVRDTTGANAVAVDEGKRRQMGPASGPPESGERAADDSRRERERERERERSGRRRDRGDERREGPRPEPERGHGRREREAVVARDRGRERSRDRAGGRDERRPRRDRDRDRGRERESERDSHRSRSAERRDRRRRDRSRERYRSRSREHRRRSPDGRSRR